MAESRRVRFITREEWRHAWTQSIKPGRAAILRVIGGIVTAALLLALGDAQAFQAWWTVVALVLGAFVAWGLPLMTNVYKAPREIAAEDRKYLETAYENVQAETSGFVGSYRSAMSRTLKPSTS